MKRFSFLAMACLGAVLTIAPSGLAQAPGAASVVTPTPERLTDADVKKLIDVVDQKRDRFEDRLEGKVKDSVVRGPTGEAHVARFLDDFQRDISNLAERFKPDYAASAEAAAVLRHASALHRFMKQQPADLKGASEWDSLAGELRRLAEVYATTFPLEGDAAVRRISDGEAAAAAEAIERQAGRIEDAVNKETSLAAPAKIALKNATDVVRKGAKTLKSRLNDSKPATAEARALFDATRTLDESSKGLGLSAPSLSLMGPMAAPLATLRQAFGVTPSPGT